jgi:hydrogenase large subunit
MPTTIVLDPVTRIEGHLKIEVTVDLVDGTQQIVDAKSSGTMFRGFENILVGRDPHDAPHLTQRICGVCPISHGMAACLNLEAAFGATAPDNGRILRNLVLGANYLQSHILHFYHLAALDYINTEGVLGKAPWVPRYVTPDMVGGATAAALVNNYVAALAIRRKAHQMGAIFGGKLPCSPSFVPGGCTAQVTTEGIDQFVALLNEIRTFVDDTMLPDVGLVASAFPAYESIGAGCGKLLAFGVFDLDASGTTRLLRRGRYDGGVSTAVDTGLITEYVASSYYTPGSGGLNPANGVTEADVHKPGAYSWLKSPRYEDSVYETGPLARMVVNGDYTGGTSVLDRVAARALEAKKVGDAMADWLGELIVGEAVYADPPTPTSASGLGLTEAPRGALGHWIDIEEGAISRYQVVTPTNWNASPRDDFGQAGPIEQALIGTEVADIAQPIEALRVVHSFDPCLACSVHMMRPDRKRAEVVVETLPLP